MSSSEEIQAVREAEIREKEKLVGIHALYDNFDGFQIEKFPDIISATDREFLRKIFEKDTEWRKEDGDFIQFTDEDKQRFKEIICKIAEGEEDDR